MFFIVKVKFYQFPKKFSTESEISTTIYLFNLIRSTFTPTIL